MLPLTIDLIAVIFAIWKAPQIVRKLGVLALTLAAIYCMIGFVLMLDYMQTLGVEAGGESMSQHVVWGGLRVSFIAPIYATIIYGITVIADIVFAFRKKK